MAYRIVYLPEAYEDIDGILAYLSQFYRGTADKFFTALRHRVGQLSEFPYLAREYRHDREFRELVVGEYCVYYMVHDQSETVEIHRVLRAKWNRPPR